MAPREPRTFGWWIAALAGAPFALAVFAVAMVLGPDLAPPLDPLEQNGSAAPAAPEPATTPTTPSKEEVTFEPWELVST